MKRNASKMFKFFARSAPLGVSTALFAACLFAAVSGKWFSEHELYKATLTPRPDGTFQFDRIGFWIAEGSVGYSNTDIHLTAGERANWFRRPGDPPGVWMRAANPPGTRFKVDAMTGLRPFRYETDRVRHGPPGFPHERTWFNARIPLWPFVLLFGYLPTRKAIDWCRGRRRFGEGCCPGCGYDLRFSPDRCPECGRPAPRDGGKVPAAAHAPV